MIFLMQALIREDGFLEELGESPSRRTSAMVKLGEGWALPNFPAQDTPHDDATTTEIDRGWLSVVPLETHLGLQDWWYGYKYSYLIQMIIT